MINLGLQDKKRKKEKQKKKIILSFSLSNQTFCLIKHGVFASKGVKFKVD
jgi:hypothetical protein